MLGTQTGGVVGLQLWPAGQNGVPPVQAPALQVWPVTQVPAVLHEVPLATLANAQAKVFAPVELQVPVVAWQGLVVCVQTTAGPAVQMPVWQESFCVQPLLSALQAVPLAALVYVQVWVVEPVDVQTPVALWHWASGGVLQSTVVPVQTPAVQMSPEVHPLPSSHAVPLVLIGFEQTPVAGLQMPTLWHWSEAVQVTGVAETQAPAAQCPFGAQAPCPVSQAVPSEPGVAQGLEGVKFQVKDVVRPALLVTTTVAWEPGVKVAPAVQEMVLFPGLLVTSISLPATKAPPLCDQRKEKGVCAVLKFGVGSSVSTPIWTVWFGWTWLVALGWRTLVICGPST